MLFDFLRRRSRERKMAAGAELAASFEAMRLAAPAAAYYFARTLFNARPLVDDETKTWREKIGAIDAEIEENEAADADEVDSIIVIVALQFIQILLAAEQRDVVSSFGYSAAFGDIVKHGEHYRDVEPRDRLPPSNDINRRVLADLGSTCVAERIDRLIAQCRDGKRDLTEIDEPKQRILALFDLQDEIDSGRWLPPMEDVAATIGVNLYSL